MRKGMMELESAFCAERAPGERGIRRHPSPPLAGVPWGRIARSVPAITTSADRHPSPRRGGVGRGWRACRPPPPSLLWRAPEDYHRRAALCARFL